MCMLSVGMVHTFWLLQDIYEQLNVFMRRKPKENNFKVCPSTGLMCIML